MSFYEDKLLPMVKVTCAVIEQTPHMRDIVNGTMPIERFRFQITHNYQYLLDYTRCWAIGLSKCGTFAQMSDWYAILSNTMEKTVLKNRDFWAIKAGLSLEEMDSAVMAEGKRSYTSFELARCQEGGLADALMALAPCNILYWYLGQDLLPLCDLPQDNMYREWLAFYVAPEYEAKCRNEIAMIDRLCADFSASEERRLLDTFAAACNYEVLQWSDMYYHMKTWPLPGLFPMRGGEKA